MNTEELVKRIRDTLSEVMDTHSSDQGEFRVVLTAVLALVESHPDPQRFADRFRSVWLGFGAPHPDEPGGQRYCAGIDLGLSLLEDRCPVPLGVRAKPR